MDVRNTLKYHFVVFLGASTLAAGLNFSGIELNRAVAGTAFFLLFLTLAVGPVMRLWRNVAEVLPWNLPWSWRGELGIWFVIFSIFHTLLVFREVQWDVLGYLLNLRLAGLAGLVALFLAIILAVTSFGRIIKFIGVSSWRWLHSFAYVIFYLLGVHVINHAFLRPGRPADWLHWSYLFMMIAIVVLQAAAFFKTVAAYRKTLPGGGQS